MNISALFGRPLATHKSPHQTIGKTVGLAVFASDALRPQPMPRGNLH